MHRVYEHLSNRTVCSSCTHTCKITYGAHKEHIIDKRIENGAAVLEAFPRGQRAARMLARRSTGAAGRSRNALSERREQDAPSLLRLPH